MEKNNFKIEPFLKWAGGKRWLVNQYLHLFPKEFNRYIEPFFGSGAVFFALKPKRPYLSDINFELIETYKALKTDWKKVKSLLMIHHRKHTNDYYYQVRSSKPRNQFSRAAKFIYLNRTCWNGLYRVNLKGEFNVPIGTKEKAILDTDNFEYTSEVLKNAQLKSVDFEKMVNTAKEGDFLFVDPPYTVKHNDNNFIKYNEKLFSWDDQTRLSKTLLRAKERGALILVTNAHHPLLVDLYKDHFNLIGITRHSVIAANSINRGKVEELLIRNYKS